MSAAELDQLAGELADAAPAPGAAPGAPGAQAPGQGGDALDLVAEHRAMLDAALDLAAPLAPEWVAAYTDAHRQTIALRFTVLAEKYGWNMGGMFEKFGDELAFGAAILLPIGPRLVAAWKASRQQPARPAPQLVDRADAPPPPAPAPAPVQPSRPPGRVELAPAP